MLRFLQGAVITPWWKILSRTHHQETKIQEDPMWIKVTLELALPLEGVIRWSFPAPFYPQMVETAGLLNLGPTLTATLMREVCAFRMKAEALRT